MILATRYSLDPGRVIPAPPTRTALVLSAGGVRGAYQVGVVAGIADVLGVRRRGRPPIFDIFVGSSVGAINATYLAANADRPDHRVDGLLEIWRSLDFDELLRPSPRGILGWPSGGARYVGRALFDPRPLATLIERAIAWDRLRANVREAVVRALVIPVFDLDRGGTTLFADLAPGLELRPPEGPMYPLVAGQTSVECVLASTALPFVFPALNINGRRYMDGALRLSTPLQPALRTGAERVLVISLLHRPPAWEGPPAYPDFRLLLAKVLGALLLDPVLPDLDNLQRINRILRALADRVDPLEPEDIRACLEELGISPDHVIPTLEIRPSVDLGVITAEFLREELHRTDIGLLDRLVLRWLGRPEDDRSSLLLSMMLFNGRLAARFAELGRRDAYALSEQILAFFHGRGD